MTSHLLETLRRVKAIDDVTGASEDGTVMFDILDRSTVGVIVGETLLRIAAEPGEDASGQHGWTLHQHLTKADPDVLAQARRIARLGLESFGYVVWEGVAP